LLRIYCRKEPSITRHLIHPRQKSTMEIVFQMRGSFYRSRRYKIHSTSYLQCVVLCWWNDPEAKSQIWLISINFDCWCKKVHGVMCDRLFIMHSTMIVRRKPPTQQSRSKLRAIPLTRKLTPRTLKEHIKHDDKNPKYQEQNELQALCIIFHINYSQKVCCTVCDSNKAFLGYREQKIFFSSHLSS
jgi:hypothetical protein